MQLYTKLTQLQNKCIKKPRSYIYERTFTNKKMIVESNLSIISIFRYDHKRYDHKRK